MAEQIVSVNDVELCVAVDGEPDAPPLVLLNGAYSNLHSWTPVLPQLLQHFRLIRHDWRGSGRSSGGARPDYNFPQYADDLAAILDHLEVARVGVCGLAYGARTAARFALNYPERVERLALYDVSLDQPVDQELQGAGNAKAKALRDEAGLPSVERELAWFEHVHQKEAMRSLTAHRNQPDPTDELADCTIPTSVVCGRQDVNLPEAERIAGLMPDARLEIIEMAGHGSIYSRPELVARHMIEFFSTPATPR